MVADETIKWVSLSFSVSRLTCYPPPPTRKSFYSYTTRYPLPAGRVPPSVRVPNRIIIASHVVSHNRWTISATYVVCWLRSLITRQDALPPTLLPCSWHLPFMPHSTHLPRCCCCCCNRLICMQQNFRVNFATQRAMLKCTMRRKQPNNICICTKYGLPLPPCPPVPHPAPYCNAAVANGRI